MSSAAAVNAQQIAALTNQMQELTCVAENTERERDFYFGSASRLSFNTPCSWR